MTPGHPKPRYRTGPLPAHGTVARWSVGCRCLPCYDGWAAYQIEYNAKRREGWTGRVPIREAQERVRHLIRKGFSLRAIAESAGLNIHTVMKIRDGSSPSIMRDTHDAIMGATGYPDSTAYVPAGPTLRLIRRINRRGVTLGEIAARLGITRKALPRPTQRNIRASRARQIEDIAVALGVIRRVAA